MLWFVIIGVIVIIGFIASGILSQYAKSTGNTELEKGAPAIVALVIVLALIAAFIALIS